MKIIIKIIKTIAIIVGILAIMPVKYHVVFESLEHKYGGINHYTSFITKESINDVVNVTFNLFHPVMFGIIFGGAILVLGMVLYGISKDFKKQ